MTNAEVAERLLDHVHSPYHLGTLPSATHYGRADSPQCGDFVVVELQLDNELRVLSAWFQHQGCLISRASASLLCEQFEGKMISDFATMSAGAYLDFIGVPLTPLRQRCALLAWQALRNALPWQQS